MSLLLDARQRAMLKEMGIELFLPEPLPDIDLEPASPVVVPASSRDPGLSPGPRVAPGVTSEGSAPVSRAPVRPAAPPAPNPAATAEGPLRERIVGVEQMDWDALETAVAEWASARSGGRSKPVFGVGDRQADWLIVGEPPGENEESEGEPFVGPEGKLLDNMLGALGLNRRRGVYLTNVLKYRPPGSRNPEPEELAEGEPFLRRQVELLQPKIILAMGRFAVQTLLQTNEPPGRLRGRVHRYQGVPVIVTYHPTSLLRNLPDKAKAWADLVLAQSVLRDSSPS